MLRSAIVVLTLAAAAGTGGALAQTANSAPTSGTAAGGGTVSRTAPSVGGGAAGTGRAGAGQAGAAAPTPLERSEEQRSQKTTSSICKGC